MINKKWTKTTLVTLTSFFVLAACGNEPAEQGADTTVTDPADETEELREESENSELDDGLGDSDTAENDTSEDTTEETDTSQTSGDGGLESQDFAADAEVAREAFRQEFGQDVLIESIVLERDDGRYIYEIDGFDSSNEYQLEIDAETEEIISSETEADIEDETPVEFEGLISAQEAMDTALAEVGSGMVTQWELDVDDGVTRYEIEIDDDIEVQVEAYEGTIVEVDN